MVKSDFQCDVLIVGGGPAGATAALTLGQKNIDTILIDKKEKNKIGDKVCGDALAPEYPREANQKIRFPIPDPQTGELMEHCKDVVLVGSDVSTRLVLGTESATVDRLRYGQKLIQEIEKLESVKIIPKTKILTVKMKNETCVGIVGYNKERGKITIDSKIIIDASGASGAVRSRLPVALCQKFPRKIPKDEMIVAYREILQTKKPHQFQNGMYFTYEPEITEVFPGYYWFFSRGEKEINVGVGYMMYEKNISKNIRKINEAIRKRYFPDAKVLESQGHQIPARLPLPSLVHNGFIMVGDAAALSNPLNGEGHGPAIISGVEAAFTIVQAIKKGDVSEQALWAYNTWAWKKYGVEFSWGIAFVKFLDKYGMETFNWLLQKGIIKEDDILKALNDPTAKFSILDRFLKGWKRLKVLNSLRKTIANAQAIQRHSLKYPAIDNFYTWNQKLNKMVKASV